MGPKRRLVLITLATDNLGMADASGWQDAKRLFEVAVTLTPAERDAYLGAHCAHDPDLRREVQSLLDWHDESETFLETPPARVADLPDVDVATLDLLGQFLGPWRIVGIVGQGGMGVVYRGERADAAFKRQVAIKVVRPGAGRAAIVDRFHLERETLAALDHPNIARLLDGGATGTGDPYFVMEFVKGVTIDRYCDDHRLTIEQRLALFREVCAAVQYAHDNLVVHRDIKPDNILVTADGTPKLLDFGVAMIVSHDYEPGRDGPGLAATHLMTPDFASPEQVSGKQSTTTADVYSLGVLLHVLLTGTRPYRLTGTTAATIREQLDAAVLSEPSRHALLGDDADERAGHRGLAPRTLAARLAGDLDSIVLRALGRTPAARYSRVEQLVADLERHRTSYPVSARPQDVAYRFGLFARRHRLAIAAAAGLALLLIAGIAVIAWQATVAATERQRAEHRFNEVRQLASVFMFDVHDAILELPGTTPARELIAKTAIRYLDSLAGEASDDLGLQRELADGFVRVGDVQGNPTNPNLGDTAGALVSYRRAVSIAEAVRAESPRDRAVAGTLALAHRRLGDVLAQTGDLAMALGELQASNALYATIAAGPAAALGDRIEAGIAAVKLGDVLGNPNFQNLGRTADADRQYAIALDAFRRLYRADTTDMRVRRYLGLTLERIGTMHEAAQRWQQAGAAYEESFAIRRALAADEPMHQNIQRDLAIAYEKLGKVHRQTDGPAAAADYFRQALSTFERLAAADPANENAARTVAISREQLADTAIAMGTTDQAIRLFREALATHRAIVGHDDRNVRAKCDAARVAESLGDALMTERNRVNVGACAEWQAALELHQRLAAAGAPACTPEPAIVRLTQKRRGC